MSIERHPASFRDPAGFVYERDGVLLRQVNGGFAREWEALRASGLPADLAREGLMVPHEEVSPALAATAEAAAVLRPERLPFISYPYEWCFGQLKDAALLTLAIMRRALEKGLVLRDASAYNVQFAGAVPRFIDALSFAPYDDGRPWAAYRQFCEHFLGPLALAARVDPALLGLHALGPDGVPVATAARLLGAPAWLRPGLAIHLMWHGRLAQRPETGERAAPARGLSRAALERLVEHLRLTVESLRWQPPRTTWSDYETTHGYSADAAKAKAELVTALLGRVHPKLVFDIGANTGAYARRAAAAGAFVVAMDSDYPAVQSLHDRLRGESAASVLPLRMDLMNPSPASGWAGRERRSLAERGPADVVMALGLVHHLVIGNGVPLPRVAEMLAELGRAAIVEFVPPDDPQALRLRTEGRLAHPYDQPSFEAAMRPHFDVVRVEPIPGSPRRLHLLTRRAP